MNAYSIPLLLSFRILFLYLPDQVGMSFQVLEYHPADKAACRDILASDCLHKPGHTFINYLVDIQDSGL